MLVHAVILVFGRLRWQDCKFKATEQKLCPSLETTIYLLQ